MNNNKTDMNTAANGEPLAELETDFRDRVEAAKALFGILPKEITLEQTREERRERI